MILAVPIQHFKHYFMCETDNKQSGIKQAKADKFYSIYIYHVYRRELKATQAFSNKINR